MSVVSQVTSRVRCITDFIDRFEMAWRSEDIPSPPKHEVHARLDALARRVGANQGVLGSILNADEVGVRQAADLILYVMSARMFYALEELVREKQRSREADLRGFVEVYFAVMNFLLVTNVFEPNDNVDQVDWGTGAYKDVHHQLRAVLARELTAALVPEGCWLPGFYARILELVDAKGLKELAKSISLPRADGRQLKAALIESAVRHLGSDEGARKAFAGWLREQDAGSPIVSNLAKRYMSERTPPFLLKNVGMAKELYVYLKFALEDYGYAVPLLLHQRLFTSLKALRIESPVGPIDRYVLFPPDFLLLKQGRVLGVELGRGKPELISTFAAVSGLPTVYISPRMENAHYMGGSRDFGYKCSLCFIPFTVCDKYVERLSLGQDFDGLPPNEVACVALCGEKVALSCADSVSIATLPGGSTGKGARLPLHYQCVKRYHPRVAQRLASNTLFPLYPSIPELVQLRIGF